MPTPCARKKAIDWNACSSPSAARSDGTAAVMHHSSPGSTVHTVAALAERFALGLRGDGATVIDGVGTLAGAGPSQLAFLANPRYRNQLADSHAGAVVMRDEDAAGYAGTALIARDPYSAFARMSALFEPQARSEEHTSELQSLMRI